MVGMVGIVGIVGFVGVIGKKMLRYYHVVFLTHILLNIWLENQ